MHVLYRHMYIYIRYVYPLGKLHKKCAYAYYMYAHALEREKSSSELVDACIIDFVSLDTNDEILYTRRKSKRGCLKIFFNVFFGVHVCMCDVCVCACVRV